MSKLYSSEKVDDALDKLDEIFSGLNLSEIEQVLFNYCACGKKQPWHPAYVSSECSRFPLGCICERDD